MSRRVFHVIASLLTLLAVTFALSGEAMAQSATDVVRDKQSKLFDLLRAGASDQEIGKIFDEMLDYGALAKASLGDEWDKRTEEERKEFTGLLESLVQRAYQKNLKKTLDFNIKYLGEEPMKNGSTKVKTRAEHKTDARAEPFEINYEMTKASGKFQVGDIETEGVSLVKSYRSQFTKILKKDGWAKLIEKMKDKVAKGGE